MTIQGEGGIAWTDRTWNPTRGCTRVSSGCMRCYAERVAARFAEPGKTFHGFAERHRGGPREWGPEFTVGRWTGRVELIPSKLNEPLSWRKAARVFVNSMSDLFHESLSDEDIAAVFGVMGAARAHTFQVLTKRPERAREWFRWAEPRLHFSFFAHGSVELRVRDRINLGTWPLPNVWLGVSVEDQRSADERIPLLLQTPTALRFVSYEPALGPVDFTGAIGWGSGWCPEHDFAGGFCIGPQCASQRQRLDWIIVGGESGPGARLCDVQWIRDVVRQCKAAQTPVFVKQLGAWWARDRRLVCTTSRGRAVQRYRARTTGNPKGGDPAEWPEDLRVREFPG